jgi:Hemerythrin HHE cation binding domain
MSTTLSSLPGTARLQQQRIQPHLDRLPELADLLGREPPAAFATEFSRECAFITGQLVPYIEAWEGALYGRLEQLMEGRHSMAPMRDEHDLLRRLISSLCAYRAMVETDELTPEAGMGLRRVLYRLYAVLKVHLAEEEQYLRVLDHNLSAEEQDALARGIGHAISEPL